MKSNKDQIKNIYEGQIYETKDKKAKFKIINFNSYKDVTIQFENTMYIKHTQIGNIKNGINCPYKENSPIMFNEPAQEYIGLTFQTNEGFVIKIIGYQNSNNVQYKFLDEYGYEGKTTLQNIRNGQIRNPFKLNEMGGFVGVGNYGGPEYKWLYSIWQNLLNRATGRRKKYHFTPNDYKDNFVANSAICDEWMCFNSFAEWYIKKLNELNPNCKYELNKDILFYLYGIQTNGIRFYGPDTVELIPEDLNTILFNNRNEAKSEEARLKVSNMSDFYYSQNMLTERAYHTIKRFFCKEMNHPIYTSLISLYDQKNILKNNIYLD